MLTSMDLQHVEELHLGKKVIFLGMAQIDIIFDALIPKTLDFHLKMDSKHFITVDFYQFIYLLP